MVDIKKIARERIELLFNKARETFIDNREDLAKRYVKIAREIAMKSQVSIPRDLKRSFCKNCGIYWLPGRSLRIRIKKKDRRIIYTCLACNAVRRLPYNILK